MITALLIAAAYVLPAIVARKRRIGVGKAFLLSMLLSPLLALPLVMRSARAAPPQPPQTDAAGEGRTLGKYGHDPEGPKVDRGWVMEERNSESAHMRTVPEDRQRQAAAREGESKGMKI